MSDKTAEDRKVLTPKERKERHREEMITAILDAARDLMREEGVGGLTMKLLARRVGMKAPSLYNYFPNKLAIYEAIFARGMRQFREGMAEKLSRAKSAAEVRHAVMEHYMSFALENPELFQLLFERPIPGFVPSEEGLQEGQKLLALGVKITEQQQQAGELDPSIPPEQARDLFIALNHGLTALHLANEPELPIGEGRFGSLMPLALKAIALVYKHGYTDE